MTVAQRRKLALALSPVPIVLLLISYTGWTSDDRVFFGGLALFLIFQVVWLGYVFRRARSESRIARTDEWFDRD